MRVDLQKEIIFFQPGGIRALPIKRAKALIKEGLPKGVHYLTLSTAIIELHISGNSERRKNFSH
jgi:hypothetical protein